MNSVFIDPNMSDEERRTRLYDGDIFILSPTAGTRALVHLARRMLEEAFLPHDPREIHEKMGVEAVAEVLAKLKPQFIHHPECKRIIPEIMREHGIDADKL